MTRRLLIPALLLAAAGCVPAPRPPAAPPPAPAKAAAPPPPPLAMDWREWPMAAGNWRYHAGGGGSRAEFGVAMQPALALLRCDLARHEITLSRAGAPSAPLTVRTSSMSRQLAAGAGISTPGQAAATLAATDPIFDAMAFSRGRFTVEQAGSVPLVLPAWAEVGRVVEDCRR